MPKVPKRLEVSESEESYTCSECDECSGEDHKDLSPSTEHIEQEKGNDIEAVAAKLE